MRLTSSEKKILILGLLFTATILGMKLTLYGQPLVTGYVVYSQQETTWDFSNAGDYAYDGELVEVANGQAKLKLANVTGRISNTSNIILPLENDEDDEYEDEYEFESEAYAYKGKLRNIHFDAELPEETKVKFKIKTAATEDELDKAKWEGPTGKKKDFYEQSGQEINPEHEENGYVQYKATLETEDEDVTPVLKNVTITFESSEYPASAPVETSDLTVQNDSSWGSLAAEEELNGQSISYEYSTDSGGSWSSIVAGNLSAAPTSSGSIRIKATLNSNGTHTPTLSSIEINYSYVSCTEKWEAQYTECSNDDARTKYYADANSCGTSDGLPDDNGTVESCDYCKPSWGCSAYAECIVGGTKACTSAADSNNCYALTGLSSDNYTGNYSELEAECSYDSDAPALESLSASPKAVNPGETIDVQANISDESNVTAAIILRNELDEISLKVAMTKANGTYSAAINTSGMKKGTYSLGVEANDTNGNLLSRKEAQLIAVATRDAVVSKLKFSNHTATLNKTESGKNRTEVLLNIFSKTDTEGEISVITYKNHSANATKPAKELGKYVEITAEEKVARNITSTTLRFYYTDEELSENNIAEETVKIHYYNRTSSEWEALNTTVNPAANYAEATIHHYSTYGIFGDEKEESSQQQSSGGSGGYGGRGSPAITTATQEASGEETAETTDSGSGKTQETTDEQREVTESARQECTYDIEATLHGSLPARQGASLEGLLANTGTCTIEQLELHLKGNASRLLRITPSVAESLEPGESLAFNLTRAAVESNPLQGLAVAEQGSPPYRAVLSIQGITGSVLQVQEDVEIPLEAEEINSNTLQGALLVAALAIASLIILKKKHRILPQRFKSNEENDKAWQNARSQ